MMKKTVIALYIVVVAILAIATIVEKYQGTPYVAEHIYGAWWFAALWALLTAVAVFYFLQRRVSRPAVVVLHLSFVVILAGALLTRLTARQGFVHLRQGLPVSDYTDDDMLTRPLPFTITLQHFEVSYHEGTEAAADYMSHVTIDGQPYTVSMNNIASHDAVRLYQSSFDPDLQGSLLAMNSDPWGIPVTYTGYALLFVALLWLLIDPKGQFRQLLRRASALAVGGLLCGQVMAAGNTTPTPRTVPQATADRLGQLYMVYNDRVCPVETYALDFTKKLSGRRSYQGLTATQVLAGFIFFYDEWTQEPVIKVKGGEMKQRLQLPDYASFNSFFTANGYILGPYLADKDIRKVDEKLSLIMELHQGRPLRLFPYAQQGRTTWYAPTDELPDSMDGEHRKYIREVCSLLNSEVQAGRFDRANAFLDKMLQYQQTFGQRSLPSATRTRAEHLYNHIPFATILFMACLTLGILAFLAMLFMPQGSRGMRWLQRTLTLLLAGCWLALTVCLALRWLITGVIPMSNGYETMLFLAWAVMLLSLFSSRRFPIMLTFGLLLAGFFLLVSHISQMDPQMTHLMPVLNSPLLTIHVSIVMMAYALLSLTFISSLTALLVRRQQAQLTLLSQLLLYPALTCLGFGIFIGAIWANISWGTYWSWDPKETWALITFMVYAAPAHRSFSPLTSSMSPTRYHLYMVAAFLTLLMTYFGVNYFLGGMHSYA